MSLLIEYVRDEMHVSLFGPSFAAAQPARVTGVVRAYPKSQFIIAFRLRRAINDCQLRREITNLATIGKRLTLLANEYCSIRIRRRQHLDLTEPDVS